MIRTTKLVVARNDVPIFDQSAFSVEIIDDAAGEYVQVQNGCGSGFLVIDPRDWPELQLAISDMIDQCKTLEEQDRESRT